MSKFVSVAIASTIFAGSIAFSGVAAAQGADVSPTRERVIAELKAARQSGELARIQSENGVFSPTELGVSRLTRVQVLDELQRARANGEIDAAFGESYAHQGATVTKSAGAPVTREQVKAELQRARKSGEFARLNGNDSHAGL